MIFKKKDKESKPKKEKHVPVMKIGTHKKTVIALWLVLIASVSFGVYKNFTASNCEYEFYRFVCGNGNEVLKGNYYYIIFTYFPHSSECW